MDAVTTLLLQVIVGGALVLLFVYCVFRAPGAAKSAGRMAAAGRKTEREQESAPAPACPREPHQTRVVIHENPVYPRVANPTAVKPQRAGSGPAQKVPTIPMGETQRIINAVIEYHKGGNWQKDLDL